MLVENRSEVDVIVRGARVLFDKGVKVTVGDAVRDVIASQLGRSTLVRSKHNCTVTFNLPDGPRGRRSYFALISWRRLSGVATPTVPLVIRLPRAELERVSASS
jgi:hypothetical protein